MLLNRRELLGKSNVIRLFVSIIFIFAIGYFFVSKALAIYGYCPAYGKFLSDEELVRIIARQINERQWVGGGRVVPYESTEAFLAANPDCCHLNDDMGGYDLAPPDVLEGLAAKTVYRLRASYSVRYMNEESTIKSGVVREQSYVGNCGQLSHSGRSMNTDKGQTSW